MQKQISPKTISLAFLVFILLGSSFSAQAIIAPQVYLEEIALPKENFEPGELIQGTVSLWNYEKFLVPDSVFNFQLVSGEVDGVPTALIDKKSGKETFSLKAGEKTTKSFAYPLPVNLPEGELKFRIQLANSRGEELGWIDKIISIGGEGEFLFLDNYWIKKNGEKLSPGGGVEYQPGEICQVIFDVYNESKFNIPAFYKITTHKRYVGQYLGEEEREGIVLNEKEKKTIEASLPRFEEPQNYLSEIRFYDPKSKEPISNSIFFRWIVAGEAAEILFVNPDKDYYLAGEKAKIKIQYVGPPHQYEIEDVEECKILVKLYDQEGNLVGMKEVISECKPKEMIVKVPITKDVKNPKIETSIIKNDKILDAYSVQAGEEEPEVETQKAISFFERNKKTLIALLVILILIISINRYLKRRQIGKAKILIFLTILASGILFTTPALAATQVNGGCCDTTINFNSPLPNQTYALGDILTFSGKFKVTSCGNGLFFNKVTFYITEDRNIPITDCCGYATDRCGAATATGWAETTGISCWCQEGCRNCYGATSTHYDNCYYQAPAFSWCDEVKYLDIDKAQTLGYKVYKLGTIYPPDTVTTWVEYNKSFVIPSNLGFSGPVRFYVQYSGTHWNAHWHWNITYQEGTIINTHSPSANAGQDKELFEGQSVILEGSGFDPDGDPITYNWSCNGGSLSNPNIGQPTYTAPAVASDTNYTCALIVRDNKGASASDSMVVRVKDTNLYVSLEAAPSTGQAPLIVSLTAAVLPQSTAIGNTANYTFWCHCVYTGTNINNARAQCGNENHKADNVNPNSYTAVDICNYLDPAGGTYTPKVIVEKGLAAAAQAQAANVTVTPFTPSPSPTASPPIPPPASPTPTILPPPPPPNPPSALNLWMNPSSCGPSCHDCENPLNPIVYWIFSDPDAGDTQSKYKIQIDNNRNFSSPEIDKENNSSSQSIAIVDGSLSYGQIYYWRVKVWDRGGNESAWACYSNSGACLPVSQLKSYTTPIHAYPQPNFCWFTGSKPCGTTIKPPLGQEVQFTDLSKVYGGADGITEIIDENVNKIISWEWTFQNGDPPTISPPGQPNPIVKFTKVGTGQKVTLIVTDKDGLFCDASKNLNVTTKLPKWKEIIPW